MIRIGNKVVAGSADVDLSTVLRALNKTNLGVWVGTQTEYEALSDTIKDNEKTTFITYDTDEDVYLIIDTIISYGKTWSSVKISSELAKKINAADVYTKEQVDEIINAKLSSALKYKGAVNTTALLPASAENGDTYFVKADGFMYAYNSTESDWDALGAVADMTNYFTKAEITAILQDKADKFQYDILPTPSSETVGVLLQYTGTDTEDYKNGYWYKGVDNGDSTYSWSVYTDDKYALSVYSNDLQLTYEGSSYTTTSALITQLTSDIVARKHSAGTIGGNIAITWTGKSCVTGSYSIHSSGAGFVVLDFENAQDGNKHCVYYISNGSATGITWSKLANTSNFYNLSSYGGYATGTKTWWKIPNLFVVGSDFTYRTNVFLLSARESSSTALLIIGDNGSNTRTARIIMLNGILDGISDFYFDDSTCSLYYAIQWSRLQIVQLSGQKINISEAIQSSSSEATQYTAITPTITATTDDIFHVGDRRSVIGWADLTSDVNVDGSSNYANNVGRIDGRNAMILVSNPTPTYQWPVTNSGNRNIFLDFGSYVQFFVDTVNNSLYVRSCDSVDMGNWGAIAMQSMLPEFKDMTTGNADELRSFANNKMYSVKVANAFNVMDDDGNAYQIPALAEAIFYKHLGDITVQFHSYYGIPGIWEIFYNSNGQTRGKKIV